MGGNSSSELQQTKENLQNTLKELNKTKQQLLVQNDELIKEFYEAQVSYSNSSLKIHNFAIKSQWIDQCENILNNLNNLKQKINKDSCNVMVFGGTQMGKSSLINFIVGTNKCKVGDGNFSTTKSFQNYETNLGGISFNFIDTMGILDNNNMNDNKNDTTEILRRIYIHFISYYTDHYIPIIQKIDLFLIVQKQEPGRDIYNKYIIEIIRHIFGDMALKRACLVLTNEDYADYQLNQEVEEKEIVRFLEFREQIDQQSQIFENRIIKVSNKQKWENDNEKEYNRQQFISEMFEIQKDISVEPPVHVYRTLFENLYINHGIKLKQLKNQYKTYIDKCQNMNIQQNYEINEGFMTKLCWLLVVQRYILDQAFTLAVKLDKMEMGDIKQLSSEQIKNQKLQKGQQQEKYHQIYIDIIKVSQINQFLQQFLLIRLGQNQPKQVVEQQPKILATADKDRYQNAKIAKNHRILLKKQHDTNKLKTAFFKIINYKFLNQ